MSQLWAYNQDVCDGDYCPMDCDHCYKQEIALGLEEEEDEDE